LFSGRYKSLLVDGSGDGYLKTVCDYVHLNPVRARLLRSEEPLRAFRWSSFPEYLKPPAQRFAWLRVDRLLGEMRIPQDSVAGRRAFERRMEERKTQAEGAEFKAVRRGWCLGEASFRRELLEQMSQRVGAHHYGAERQESSEAKAERLVAEELKRRGWSEARLSETAKGDPEKLQIARRLRMETIMTLRWIAKRLKMGSWTYVSNLLARVKSED
jgi:hypothetical protein